jgi:hypothetical protein
MMKKKPSSRKLDAINGKKQMHNNGNSKFISMKNIFLNLQASHDDDDGRIVVRQHSFSNPQMQNGNGEETQALRQNS